MKKSIFFFIAILLITIAQVFGQKGKELTIGAGAAFTNVWIVNQNFYGEPEVNYVPKIGYSVSFDMGYNFTENVSILTEIQYSLQGQKYGDKQTINGVKYEVDRNIDLRYMNIPLFFKYAFGQKDTKFRLMVGPQLGVLLEATQEYLRDGQKLGTPAINLDGEEFETDDGQITDRYNPYDYGISIDIGGDVHLSKVFFISGGIRGNYGFTDINAPAYRLNDMDGEYSPSHNAWGGIYISIHYKVDVEGYNQRSF